METGSYHTWCNTARDKIEFIKKSNRNLLKEWIEAHCIRTYQLKHYEFVQVSVVCYVDSDIFIWLLISCTDICHIISSDLHINWDFMIENLEFDFNTKILFEDKYTAMIWMSVNVADRTGLKP